MYLEFLHLHNFRNYREQVVTFDAPKTILLGDNAQGKSNLLEAVELLSTLKSHRATRDRDLVMAGAMEARIAARAARSHGTRELALTLRTQGRRTATLDREQLKRQMDFLGVLNAVEFSCLDLDLVRGAPEARRQWIDGLLFQVEPIYASILQEYNRVLKQRNSLLKQSLDGDIERGQLEVWNQQLIVTGVRTIRRRARIIDRLTPLASAWHEQISGRTERLAIDYRPSIPVMADNPEVIQQAFTERIASRQVAELSLGTSLVGPHRDDIELAIDDTLAKAYGSQGQQRTLVLALKLAELELIEQIVGEPPLLLLDDVLAELDLHRQNQLLSAIADRFQTIVTTTHLGSFDRDWLNASQILHVSNGRIESA